MSEFPVDVFANTDGGQRSEGAEVIELLDYQRGIFAARVANKLKFFEKGQLERVQINGLELRCFLAYLFECGWSWLDPCLTLFTSFTDNTNADETLNKLLPSVRSELLPRSATSSGDRSVITMYNQFGAFPHAESSFRLNRAVLHHTTGGRWSVNMRPGGECMLVKYQTAT